MSLNLITVIALSIVVAFALFVACGYAVLWLITHNPVPPLHEQKRLMWRVDKKRRKT